jgi:hypothetical protein
MLQGNSTVAFIFAIIVLIAITNFMSRTETIGLSIILIAGALLINHEYAPDGGIFETLGFTSPTVGETSTPFQKIIQNAETTKL